MRCEQFVVDEHPALLRAALLLTGDQMAAQDLVQETLVRVLLQWRKVARADSPQAYTRRILLNTFLGGRRRSWHGEVPHDRLPEAPTASAYDAVDDADLLRRALRALAPRQRAAVVLRHYEGRSEAETAQLLGCSAGTVKSLTSRGLANLRSQLGTQEPEGTARR